MSSDATARWSRLMRALGQEPLPAALVDLDALEANAATLHAPARANRKTLRLATKSLRCVGLVRRIQALGAGVVKGLMTYTAGETAFLAEQGFDDLLLAYPTARAPDAALLARTAASGKTVAAVVDAPEHLALLEAAAKERNTRLGVVLELDVAYRPIGGVAHLGSRRSPLRTADQLLALAREVRKAQHLTLDGVMAYESQIAGSTDQNPFSPLLNGPKWAVKRLSRPYVEAIRAEVARRLREEGFQIRLFNGGGTGSLTWASTEACLTEVTVGSGYLDSHLFGYYRELSLTPAAYFGLQVVRRPGPGLVTCHGGGYVASGEAGPDRLPVPALPEGCKLLTFEGAGEVQTPLALGAGVELALGDPVFFRHAKAGELAEHFNEYLLVRGDRVEARERTYRGMGQCFLG